MGITKKAKPRAIPYSVQPTGVKPKALAKNGISSKAVVRISEPIMAAHKTLFCPRRLKTDFLCERRLKEWNISHMDIVRNAIVIPCRDEPTGSEKTPLSKKWPMRYNNPSFLRLLLDRVIDPFDFCKYDLMILGLF